MADNQQNPIEGQIENTEFGRIRTVSIREEMEKSYLDYAMSVIVSRALPDVRDGLKPVQRRILYAMKLLSLLPPSGYKKSARIVGEVIGKFHPHGDMAVYEALVRIAQDFSLRYPLVDGQGNFGSMDGDPPAAPRYTEARLQKISGEILGDLEANTVDFSENFDGTEREPSVLPGLVPNLLVNGVDGIAVGMATRIPPHNLNEIVNALIHIIDTAKITPYENDEAFVGDNPEFHDRMINFYTKYDNNAPYFEKPPITHFYLDASEIETEDLMKFVPAPDFPTGGEVFDKKEIMQAYATGRGRVLMRAITAIIEGNQGKMLIEITELPFQQNKAMLIAKIADLVKEDKIQDISDLRDESDRTGLKIVVELKRGSNPQRVLNQLFKLTPMQQTFHMNMVALENNTPRVMTLKSILVAYLKHRKEIIIRRTAHELINLLHRNHILEGLKIALDHLDEVIQTIRQSPDADEAKMNLINKFSLSEIQAQAILDMQLRRLAALEREKILNELKDVSGKITTLKAILTSPERVTQIMKEELEQLAKTYGDKRRTKVTSGLPGEISDDELIKEEETIVVLSRGGYIKRVPPETFKPQGRGGKGVSGGNLKEEDVVSILASASTHDEVLFFTSKGRVFSKRVWDIPESSRTARGTPVVNVVGIDQGETITSILTLRKENKK